MVNNSSPSPDYQKVLSINREARKVVIKIDRLPIGALLALVGFGFVSGIVLGGLYWTLFGISILPAIFKIWATTYWFPKQDERRTKLYDNVVSRVEEIFSLEIDEPTRDRLIEFLFEQPPDFISSHRLPEKNQSNKLLAEPPPEEEKE